MKKTVSLLLLFVLCTVCASAVYAMDVVVDLEELHETYEPDGVVLAELNAEFPQLRGMTDTEVMERVNAGIRDFIRSDSGFDIACEYALGDYVDIPEKFAETTYGVDARAQAELLRDGTLLAVRYDFLFEAGGPHPWDTIAVLHFDLATGERVTVEDLSRDPDLLSEQVASIVMDQITVEEVFLFEDANIKAYVQYLLTAEGLVAFFNEGDIAPVAEGPLEILIPYDKLLDVLEWEQSKNF